VSETVTRGINYANVAHVESLSTPEETLPRATAAREIARV